MRSLKEFLEIDQTKGDKGCKGLAATVSYGFLQVSFRFPTDFLLGSQYWFLSGRHLRFEDLLQALHLWSGQAVAERVASDDLLPHLQWGLLVKRSFLDLRIFDHWNFWKNRNLCTANLLAHHFHQKAVGWKVLGNRLAPPRGCAALAEALPPRCVLLVRLQHMAEEMVELTLRLAAAQTRKPEEQSHSMDDFLTGYCWYCWFIA